MNNYDKIEKAIYYIRENFKKQPELDEIAQSVHLSSYHFQRMFKQWAGVSPKKFLQFISIEYSKKLLKENRSLFNVAIETGFSGSSRLHDLFVNIEAMTPGEYKNGGKSLNIKYSFANSPFGKIIIASTYKGICHISFIKNKTEAITNLIDKFPEASFNQSVDSFQQKALKIFNLDWSDLSKIKLHLKGTAFQLKVWETLLNIPFGGLISYSKIAEQINNPLASRAIGSAVATNPVAYLIPCHRVIKSTGDFGEYHWGEIRKTAIIGWENSRLNSLN